MALDAVPSRVPVVIGPSGSGRTSVLRRVAARLGEQQGHYVDAERIISTPERFLAAVAGSGGERTAAPSPGNSPRTAFDALLARVGQPQPDGRQQPVLLLDEFVEIERLSAFPGLRGVLNEFLGAIAFSPNRFVLASCFVTRSTRLLGTLPANRFSMIDLPHLTTAEVRTVLAEQTGSHDDADLVELARAVQALADGRPSYVHQIATALAADEGAGDPVSALAALMTTGAPLATLCRLTYEMRLHRARGYSALKGILTTLAEEEPLTLTGIARRLGRTPGSTKDYLSWLVDVDLIATEQKRYRFLDPLLRLWVRLHCRPAPPDEIALAREVQDYAVGRMPLAGKTSGADADVPSQGTSIEEPPLPPAPVDLMEID